MKHSGLTLNLRQRLVSLLMLASLPGMAVAVWLAVEALETQSQQIEIGVARLASLQAAQQNNIVENARVMLTTLVHSDALGDLDGPQCSSFMSEWLDRFPSFNSLVLVDGTGRTLCADSGSEVPSDLSQQSWFERVTSEREFVVGKYTLDRAGSPLFLAAYPVVDSVRGSVGALVVGIDLRWFDFLARTIDLPPKATITALGIDGEVLTQHLALDADGKAAKETDVDGSRPSREFRNMMTGGADHGTILGETESGEARVYGFHRTDSGDLVVAVGMPRFIDFERIGAALVGTLSAPLSILVLALLAAAWGSESYITRWIRRLTVEARRMAAGERGVRSGVPHSRYEIGKLAAAFDQMADAIEDREQELEESARLRGILLDEMNHRVKNDMQVVISLIRMEATRLEAGEARERVEGLVGRIRTLAEIHTLLYRSYTGRGGLETNYAAELCKLLWRFRAETDERIEMKLEIEPIPLTMRNAIPFGLILNELIANSYKHAFQDEDRGTVWIRLVQVEEDGASQARLTVMDDGPGPASEVDVDDPESTGMTLVKALARQLEGTFCLKRESDRTICEVRFPLDREATES